MLFSLPRPTWPLAREFPPLTLVKINVPDREETFGAVIDYGATRDGIPLVISAVLDRDGQMLRDPNGELQVAIAEPRALSTIASCGMFMTSWMARHFCDA